MTYLNRTLCVVLEEMRKCYETHNYSYLPGLIEEAQSMGNRMEAALEDQRDFERAFEKKKIAEKELDAVEKKLEKAKQELEKK